MQALENYFIVDTFSLISFWSTDINYKPLPLNVVWLFVILTMFA